MAQPLGNYTYADPGPVAGWARRGLYACIGVSALAAISAGMQYLLIRETGDHYSGLEVEWVINNIRQGVVRLLLLAVTLATAIAILRWLYRAAANDWSLSSFEMKFTPGWAAGWFLVPVAHLWQPYEVLKEMWRENVDPEENEPPRLYPLLLWQGAWFATAILFPLLLWLSRQPNPRLMVAGTLLTIIFHLLCIVRDLALLSIIRAVTAAQRARYERQESGRGLEGESAGTIAWE